MKIRVRKSGARLRLKYWKIIRERVIERNWHKWFAWHPVRIPTYGKMSGMKLAWFEVVDRRCISAPCLNDIDKMLINFHGERRNYEYK